MSNKTNRPWTTLWDRTNRRVLLLAGANDIKRNWWDFVRHDDSASVSGAYDIWRDESEDIVFVEVRLDDKDTPLGFPKDLLDEGLLGSQTIWPMPSMDSFIWWHEA
jgi:hypothetical protein